MNDNNYLHGPTNLRPEDYGLLGPLNWLEQDSQGFPRITDNPDLRNALRERNGSKYETDYRCAHCGAHLHWVYVVEHTPTGKVIPIGHDCASNRFGLSNEAYKLFHTQLEEMRAKQRICRAREEWLNQMVSHRMAFDFINEYGQNNLFLLDLARRLNKSGELSVKQVEAVLRIKRRAEVWQDDTSVDDVRKFLQSVSWYEGDPSQDKGPSFLQKMKAAAELGLTTNMIDAVRREMIKQQRKVDNGAKPVEAGRYRIEGRVVKARWMENPRYGYTLKGLIEDDTGRTFWGTIPTVILEKLGLDDDGGDEKIMSVIEGHVIVAFYAKVKPSEEDPFFGYYSRPTKPAVISRGIGLEQKNTENVQ
jgi:hypothetical protein